MNDSHGIDVCVITHGWPRVKFPVCEEMLLRFRRRVDISGGPDACWPWTGRVHIKGYGLCDYDKRPGTAHRMSWVLHSGKHIPDGLMVCHRCDNPICCNPSHLFIGTAQQNSDDMKNKGRSATGEKSGMHKRPDKRSPGELHGQSKFRNEDIIEIRRLCSGGIAHAEIASRFGTSKAYVSSIARRLRWKHI